MGFKLLAILASVVVVIQITNAETSDGPFSDNFCADSVCRFQQDLEHRANDGK